MKIAVPLPFMKQQKEENATKAMLQVVKEGEDLKRRRDERLKWSWVEWPLLSRHFLARGEKPNFDVHRCDFPYYSYALKLDIKILFIKD